MTEIEVVKPQLSHEIDLVSAIQGLGAKITAKELESIMKFLDFRNVLWEQE